MPSEAAVENARTRLFASVLLAAWFLLVYSLGANGTFVRSPETPPLPLAAGVIAPLVVFAVAYFASARFRAFVLSADLRLMTAIQAWRAGGLAFIALHTHGLLPGLFAWPAGLGDIAIGVTAPWVLLALLRRPDYAASRGFVVWNSLGILDLVVAISTGVLGSGFVPGLVGVTTAPMSRLPLVLIPTYLVPLFVMLHVSALAQAKRLRRPAGAPRRGRVPTEPAVTAPPSPSPLGV